MLAQGAADALAFGQQPANGLVRFGIADPAADRQGLVAEQDQADKGHLEVLAQAVFDTDDQVIQAVGVHQGEDQAAGLVEQPIVVAGDIHQLRKTVAHLDVAFAQDFHLPLDQRDGIATLVRYAQGREQFFVLDEEIRMSLKVRGNRRRLQALGRAFVGLRGWNLGLISHGFSSLKDALVLRIRVLPDRSSSPVGQDLPIQWTSARRAGRSIAANPSTPG